MSAENTPPTTIARVIGAVMAHHLWTTEEVGENLADWLGKAEQHLSADGIRQLLGKQSEDVCRLLQAACIEKALLGDITPETKEAIEKLSADDKVLVTTVYMTSVGEQPLNPGREKGHWAQPLWKLKQWGRGFIAKSPIQIPKGQLTQVVKDVVWHATAGLRDKALTMLG